MSKQKKTKKQQRPRNCVHEEGLTQVLAVTVPVALVEKLDILAAKRFERNRSRAATEALRQYLST